MQPNRANIPRYETPLPEGNQPIQRKYSYTQGFNFGSK